MRRCVSVIAVLLTIARTGATQEPHHHAPTARALGSVTFVNSGAAAAQAPFLRGIALLHSFEYDDAAAAFREAQREDPGFALAYWSEALTSSKLLWGLEDLPAARAALARLAPTTAERLARARTPRERAWGAAVEAFYADADLSHRTLAYADSMRLLAKAWPADHEAAAFAALALLMAANAADLAPGQDTVLRNEAIVLATRVYRANPRHPGATHYLIHAYDDPALAARGLEFARAYARVAPDAEHALHMPSHIFLQVGQWDDVVQSNERAWAASRADAGRHGGSADRLDFHALQWLQYGYLEQGRFAAARGLIDTAAAVLKGVDVAGDPDMRFAVPTLTFAWAAAAGRWEATADLAEPAAPPADASARSRSFTAAARFQAAYAAAMRGDTAVSMRALRTINAALDSLPPESARRPRLMLLAAQLEGAMAMQRGEPAKAVELLSHWADVDNHSSPAGPPRYPPIGEQLGAALLGAGRPREAAAAYEAASTARPNRSESLAGLVRARTLLADVAGAADARRKLAANWHAADPDVSQAIRTP
jgi:tetratricopeptide (TPR) repeat protein